jgi:hypothetical protein
MSIGKDGKILSVSGKIIGETCSRQSVGKRISSETRSALLAV